MQSLWSQSSIESRLAIVRRARGLIAERAGELAGTVSRDPADTLVAEVLPLAEACAFLERGAKQILAPRRVRDRRPMWLQGVQLEIHREPLGTVLVIGPANYPLFLPGTHALQALVAGNTAIVKPGRQGSAAMMALAAILQDAGLPQGVLTVLSEDPSEAEAVIARGVDKVIVTGSHSTGQAVTAQLVNHVTPAVMELSGCDPVFVLADADLAVVADALRFGLTLNNGETCIAPKKVYVPRNREAELRNRLGSVRIPIAGVDSEDEAIALAGGCGYALGASIFGSSDKAVALAKRVRAGVVVINDMIVPTADPRLPFGGRGKSGFGTTRGAEGLLEMTALKAITVRKGSWRPHFGAKHRTDSELFQAFIAAMHGPSWRSRVKAFVRMSRVAMSRGKAA